MSIMLLSGKREKHMAFIQCPAVGTDGCRRPFRRNMPDGTQTLKIFYSKSAHNSFIVLLRPTLYRADAVGFNQAPAGGRLRDDEAVTFDAYLHARLVEPV